MKSQKKKKKKKERKKNTTRWKTIFTHIVTRCNELYSKMKNKTKYTN